MKKSVKIGLFLTGFLMITTGCNVNYCNDTDIANIKAMYDLKTSIFVVDKVLDYAKNDQIEITIPQEKDEELVNEVFTYVISEKYYSEVEKYLTNNTQDSSNKIKSYLNVDGMEEKVENENYIELHTLLTTPKTIEGTENTTYLNKYYPNATGGLNALKNDKTLKTMSTCLSIDGNDKEPNSGASLEKKSWGDAWKKGPLQGLITYPIAFGLISFTKLIGESGVGQILSILFVTIIVRLLILLATFKQTVQQQKMQIIQPELSAIQVKYQGKTDQASKQKMSEEMMKLYKKYDVNPMKSLIMPFISMPIFFCVYHAVNNTAILKSGNVFGVKLGDAMSTGILGLKWFAIVLFIIMVATQYVSMKLPQWLQKFKNKERRPDPRIEQTQKQTNTMTTVFFVMIVFMGWMLPTSMTVYWIASSIVSVAQTLISQKILGSKSKQELMKKK